VVVVTAYPNWHKAPEGFGSALKEREIERKREPLTVQILFAFHLFCSQIYLILS